MSDFTIVPFEDRLEIERAFNEWVDKNGLAKVPITLVAFLNINGLLNTEKRLNGAERDGRKSRLRRKSDGRMPM